MRIRRSLLACAVFLAAGCARHTAPPPPPPSLSLPASSSGINVLLTWDAPVDLDLYLTDPTAETVYFANNPSRTGARLLRDTRCSDLGTTKGVLLEHASVPIPRAGRYRIGVDFIDACGSTQQPASFRVTVEFAGKRREAIGTIHLQEFQPIVLEFEIHPLDGDGPLALSQEDR
jgi:hypothetical protein